MEIAQKDVVLLPFPFSDLGGKKFRPALIISNETLNKKSADCLMVPLTTVIKDEPYSIVIDDKDIKTGELANRSRVRVDKIFSVEKRLIVAKIATLKDETFERVKTELFKMF